MYVCMLVDSIDVAEGTNAVGMLETVDICVCYAAACVCVCASASVCMCLDVYVCFRVYSTVCVCVLCVGRPTHTP